MDFSTPKKENNCLKKKKIGNNEFLNFFLQLVDIPIFSRYFDILWFVTDFQNTFFWHYLFFFILEFCYGFSGRSNFFFLGTFVEFWIFFPLLFRLIVIFFCFLFQMWWKRFRITAMSVRDVENAPEKRKVLRTVIFEYHVNRRKLYSIQTATP